MQCGNRIALRSARHTRPGALDLSSLLPNGYPIEAYLAAMASIGRLYEVESQGARCRGAARIAPRAITPAARVPAHLADRAAVGRAAQEPHRKRHRLHAGQLASAVPVHR